jgi:hypothetical protein
VRISQASAAYTAAAQGIAQGKRKTPESIFIENRVPGLVPARLGSRPRPAERAGTEWERPSNV